MKIIEKPSTNFSNRALDTKINSIVLHYTGMNNCNEALSRMCDPIFEVSAHYCIDRNGDIYQLIEEKKKAWHAGKSYWREQEGLNENSIGIELVNKGHEWGYEEFTNRQIESAIELCQNIMNRHNIDQRNIVGHSDIAPDRKEDPGEYFPWIRLSNECIGLWHDKNVDSSEYDDHIYTVGEIIKAKKELAHIGYFVHPTDSLDKQFILVLTAFYRRFFTKRILMQENKRYPKNIHLDGKAIELISKVAELYK